MYIIVSKLLYSLDSAQLNECEKNRLDAFQAKCLRRILKISHSYYSRISNDQILQCAHAQPLTIILVKRQLKLFSHIALMPSSYCIRSMVFDGDTSTKPTLAPRRRGRPRKCWIDEMHNIAACTAGSNHDLISIFCQCSSSLKPWLDAVDSYLSPSNLQ